MVKKLLYLLLFLNLVGGVILLDHRLTKSGRLSHAQRRDELMRIRDQILRYEYEQGSMPQSLESMIPAYLTRKHLGPETDPLYEYDPVARSIAMAHGTPVSGLYSRTIEPAVFVMPPPIKSTPGEERHDNIDEVEIIVPEGPELRDPPPGSFVFEAEHYSATNYGWEVTPDPKAGGGAYLHIKEGMANRSGQESFHLGDFYNIGDNRSYTFVRHHFNLPESKKYYVYGRMWTTGSHCSNNLSIALDRGGPGIGSMANRTPFRWVWTPISGLCPRHIPAGDHFLHTFPHEDGVRVDQFIISPVPVKGSDAYKANMVTGSNTAFLKSVRQPLHLSFDCKSLIITPKILPDVKLALRRITACEGRGRLRIVLKKAGAGGGELQLLDGRIDLSALPQLSFVRIDFSKLLFDKLPRREYLLVAIVSSGENELARCHIPLMYPYQWKILGPFKYFANGAAGPFDSRKEPVEGKGHQWKPFDPKLFDHFGVFDFGLYTIGNSLQAPTMKTIYIAAEIEVKERSECMLKIQSDDQMILWIDGREACRMDTMRPVTRAGKRRRLIFTPGRHRLKMRINQGWKDSYGDGRWQASLRIRTRDDQVSDIIGVEE